MSRNPVVPACRVDLSRLFVTVLPDRRSWVLAAQRLDMTSRGCMRARLCFTKENESSDAADFPLAKDGVPRRSSRKRAKSGGGGGSRTRVRKPSASHLKPFILHAVFLFGPNHVVAEGQGVNCGVLDRDSLL